MSLENTKRVLRYLLAKKGFTLSDVGEIIGVETEAYVDKMLRDGLVNNKIFSVLDTLMDTYKGDSHLKVVEFIAGSLFIESQKSVVFFKNVFEIKIKDEEIKSVFDKILEIPDKYIIINKNDSRLDMRNYYIDTLNNYVSEMSVDELRIMLVSIMNNGSA